MRAFNLMSKPSKGLISALVVFGVFALVYGVKFFIDSSRSGIGESASARVKGVEDAPVRIVEFIDFQCPACAQGAKFLKSFMEQHPGKLRLELKYFPFKTHRHGMLSAQYAECAARQGKFWPYHDYLVERQNNWKRLEDAKPAFDFMAKEVGLDSAQLETCLADESVVSFLEKHKKEGTSLGVRQTPTYFINGKMVVGKKSLQLKLSELFNDSQN